MQNIESLLNNTVAPNVSLTRANSVVPDSQLSPGFSSSQLMQQQLSPNQRTQLSPQQTGMFHFTDQKFPAKHQTTSNLAGFQGNPFNNNPGHRMSPQQQQQLVAAGFQQGNPGNQQLSPRQPPFSGSQQMPQASSAALQQQQQQQWQQNNRPSIQQQNPMLNAQLSVGLHFHNLLNRTGLQKISILDGPRIQSCCRREPTICSSPATAITELTRSATAGLVWQHGGWKRIPRTTKSFAIHCCPRAKLRKSRLCQSTNATATTG